MNNPKHSKPTEHEALDWAYVAIATAIIVALILAAIMGHHIVSLGVKL